MKWLKQLQSLHTKLVIVYVLLIIIGMQIIGLYFTNSLEKELLDNFKKNITQYAKPVSYTHLTLPTIAAECRSRWSPDH